MFWCVVSLYISLVVCILTRPSGSSKYSTTHKNIPRYYTPKHLIRYMYLNYRNFFYLEDFVGGIGIMLLKFRLRRSPDIFETMPREAKGGNVEVYIVYIYICAWFSRCGRFGIASVLQQFRATSTCCSLSLAGQVCPCSLSSASLARLVSASSFNHSFWLQCDPRSLRAKDLVRRWTCGFHQIFASSASSKTKMGRRFLALSSWCLRWKDQIWSRTVRVHKQNITQFALHVTTGDQFGVNAP